MDAESVEELVPLAELVVTGALWDAGEVELLDVVVVVIGAECVCISVVPLVVHRLVNVV